MKLFIIILLILIAFLFEKKIINQKIFEEYRQNSCNPKCKEGLYNKYIIPPDGANWYNKIIMGCSSMLNFKTPCVQENFINMNESRPNVWVYIPDEYSSRYWKHFRSRTQKQDIPEYIQLCLQTLFKFNKNMNIYLLDDTTITSVFKKHCPFQWTDTRINKQLKLDYLKFYLLYNYGGIWIHPETIIFKNLSVVTDKLLTHSLITVGCNPDEEDYNNFIILGGSKHSKICEIILQKISILLKKYINNYTFNTNYINSILKSTKLKYFKYHFSQEYNGTIDINDKPIIYENLLSESSTYFKNIDKIILLKINKKAISKHHHYNWFNRLNKKQILDSDLWISKLFNYILPNN